MHEATHRVVFGRIIRNSSAAQHVDDLLVRADPDREHRFDRSETLPAVPADDVSHGSCDRISRSNRGLNVHYEDRVIAGVGQQHLKRCRIARSVRVANDVDRIRSGPRRWQNRIKSFAGSGLDRRGGTAEFDEPVDCENADATTVGQDCQPLSRGRFDAPQRLGAVEQLAKVRHPQHPCATKCGVIDRVRTSQRAGMGRGRLCPLGDASRFDDHDRLDPGRGTRRRHELAGVLDRFDIEHDGARLGIQREVIEQIGDIDVELVAD